ncbi:MAG TPA: NUDIX domain-containing protein [Flavilitoribacter sp.]|nr:NUDIX domain-containing protein [Flavilitoribacter sp.]HMQ91435.1 NUDIX domain-containing protein [Flavilitoribacter sp.]
MTDLNNFFKSAFTVDNVIFGFDEADLKVLLIKRGEEPYKDTWALPGYFVYPNENLDEAAGRVLEELTGLQNVFLEQVKTFGAVNRHPFGRVITVAYFSLVKINAYNVQAASIASDAEWHSVSDVKDLPFDHMEILKACFNRLKWSIRTRPVGFELLPPKFTLTELQHLYEAILETPLEKRNFRKKILSMNLLIDLEESQEGVAHRPARLYQFDPEKYRQFLSEGFIFELKETKKRDNRRKLQEV